MSKFSLRLYRTDRGLVDEPLDADDEVEARELARMRLLLTRDFDRIQLWRDGAALGDWRRDSPPAH